MESKKILTEEIIPALKAKLDEAGSTKLYSDYGTNTDGAMTQKFISDTLNSRHVIIGQNASTNQSSSDKVIAIGQNAKANGMFSVALFGTVTESASGGIAIGSGSIARHSSSLAIGEMAETTREHEISFGNIYDAASGSHYLANVRPGELDNDAVNLKQLNDATYSLKPVTLYEMPLEEMGNDRPSTFELTESVFNFEYIEIFTILSPTIGNKNTLDGQVKVTRYYPEIGKKQYELQAPADSSDPVKYPSPGGFSITEQYFTVGDDVTTNVTEKFMIGPFSSDPSATSEGTEIYDRGSLDGARRRELVVLKILGYNRIVTT